MYLLMKGFLGDSPLFPGRRWSCSGRAFIQTTFLSSYQELLFARSLKDFFGPNNRF